MEFAIEKCNRLIMNDEKKETVVRIKQRKQGNLWASWREEKL